MSTIDRQVSSRPLSSQGAILVREPCPLSYGFDGRCLLRTTLLNSNLRIKLPARDITEPGRGIHHSTPVEYDSSPVKLTVR